VENTCSLEVFEEVPSDVYTLDTFYRVAHQVYSESFREVTVDPVVYHPSICQFHHNIKSLEIFVELFPVPWSHSSVFVSNNSKIKGASLLCDQF
jgi:hypothetical protein